MFWKKHVSIISHRIHGTGIFTYIYHNNQPNVGKYTSPMDPNNQANVGKYTSPMDPMGIIVGVYSTFGNMTFHVSPTTWIFVEGDFLCTMGFITIVHQNIF